MNKKRKPTHPGAILKIFVLPALKDKGITKKQFANALGISRNFLYGILNEENSITPKHRNKTWQDTW